MKPYVEPWDDFISVNTLPYAFRFSGGKKQEVCQEQGQTTTFTKVGKFGSKLDMQGLSRQDHTWVVRH